LLGIVHMNPEIKHEQWDHSEVRIIISLMPNISIGFCC
jgi:hypothetical protein